MNKFDYSKKTMDSLFSDFASVCHFISGQNNQSVLCRLAKEIEEEWSAAKAFRESQFVPVKNTLDTKAIRLASNEMYSVGKVKFTFNSLLSLFFLINRQRGREILIASDFTLGSGTEYPFSLREAFDFTEGTASESLIRTKNDIYEKYLKRYSNLLLQINHLCSSSANELNRLFMQSSGIKGIDEPEDFFPIISFDLDYSQDCYWSNDIFFRMQNLVKAEGVLWQESQNRIPSLFFNDILATLDYFVIVVGGYKLYRPINNFKRIYTKKVDGKSVESIMKEKLDRQTLAFLEEFITVWK